MKSGGALTWNWLVHFDEIGRYISDEIGHMLVGMTTFVEPNWSKPLKEFGAGDVQVVEPPDAIKTVLMR